MHTTIEFWLKYAVYTCSLQFTCWLGLALHWAGKNRLEMFLGMPQSGARLHADSVCEPIFSVQLAGHKLWRLSPLPPYKRAMKTDTATYLRQRERTVTPQGAMMTAGWPES